MYWHYRSCRSADERYMVASYPTMPRRQPNPIGLLDITSFTLPATRASPYGERFILPDLPDLTMVLYLQT